MCSIVYIKCVTESERVTERVRELVVARSSFLVSAVPAGNIKNRKARTAVAIIVVVVVLYKREYNMHHVRPVTGREEESALETMSWRLCANCLSFSIGEGGDYKNDNRNMYNLFFTQIAHIFWVSYTIICLKVKHGYNSRYLPIHVITCMLIYTCIGRTVIST